MILNILDFLNNLPETKNLAVIRQLIQAEISKYSGMRQVLENTSANKKLTSEILSSIDLYLEDLESVNRKFRHTHLALFKLKPAEDPQINRKVLEILKAVIAR